MNFLRSYNVLSDCRIALELLEEERDQDKWRVHWVGAVALIRAVGHVLRHVDRERYPQFEACIDDMFASWKTGNEHQIFRDFIDQERNNVLKEYESSIHPLGVCRVVTVGKRFVVRMPADDGQMTDYFELDENLFRPRLDGYLAGEDARDIYRQAITWWDEQLISIVA